MQAGIAPWIDIVACCCCCCSCPAVARCLPIDEDVAPWKMEQRPICNLATREIHTHTHTHIGKFRVTVTVRDRVSESTVAVSFICISWRPLFTPLALQYSYPAFHGFVSVSGGDRKLVCQSNRHCHPQEVATFTILIRVIVVVVADLVGAGSQKVRQRREE